MIYAVGLALIFIVGLYLLALGLGYIFVPLTLSGKPHIKIIGIVLLAGTIGISGSWFAFKTATPGPAVVQSSQYATAWLATRVMRSRVDLPYEVSPELVIEDIRSYENRLIYIMAARAPSSQNFISMAQAMRSDMHNNGCRREDYRALLRLGLVIEIDIHASNGWGTDPLVLTAEQCGL